MKLIRRRRVIGQSWGLGRILFLVVFTVVFTSLGLWQVNRQYDVVRKGYGIDKDLFEYRRMLESEKRLTLLISAYKDPTALEAFAEDELGMRRPERNDELVVPSPGGDRVEPLGATGGTGSDRAADGDSGSQVGRGAAELVVPTPGGDRVEPAAGGDGGPQVDRGAAGLEVPTPGAHVLETPPSTEEESP